MDTDQKKKKKSWVGLPWQSGIMTSDEWSSTKWHLAGKKSFLRCFTDLTQLPATSRYSVSLTKLLGSTGPCPKPHKKAKASKGTTTLKRWTADDQNKHVETHKNAMNGNKSILCNGWQIGSWGLGLIRPVCSKWQTLHTLYLAKCSYSRLRARTYRDTLR